MCYVVECYHDFFLAVFIYSCPGFKSSIKERMLYSSCKEPLIAGIEEDLGIKVTKKVCTTPCHQCWIIINYHHVPSTVATYFSVVMR